MYSYGKLITTLVLFSCAIRFGVAAPSYLLPDTMFLLFGMQQGQGSPIMYFVKVWAVRDIVLALLVVFASRQHIKTLLAACVAIESSDALAVYLTYSAGTFSGIQALNQLSTVALALVSEAAALVMISRQDARAGA
jgi:hypothetical protein